MENIGLVIRRTFENWYSNGYKHFLQTTVNENSINLVVPINKETILVPIVALDTLATTEGILDKKPADSIVITLDNIGKQTTYKSLDAGMKDVLTSVLSRYSLVKLPQKNPTDPIYYGTCGAIFDKEFKPIMMMLWEMKKVISSDEDQEVKLKFIRPIVWIDAYTYIYKSNAVERFIANKITTEALNNHYIEIARVRNNGHFIYEDYNCRFTPKVIIDECPFELQKTDVPSISTTNEELLDVALNYIEEVVQ